MVLHRDEPCPTVDPLQVERLGELPGVHGRGAEIAHLASLHHVVEGFERLLPRGRVVVAVDLVQVDVVRAEPAQRMVDLGHDRLAGQAAAVGSWSHRVAQFGGDDDGVAIGEVLECAAEDLLAGAVGVHVRCVEEVDPRLERVLDQRRAPRPRPSTRRGGRGRARRRSSRRSRSGETSRPVVPSLM